MLTSKKQNMHIVMEIQFSYWLAFYLIAVLGNKTQLKYLQS